VIHDSRLTRVPASTGARVTARHCFQARVVAQFVRVTARTVTVEVAGYDVHMRYPALVFASTLFVISTLGCGGSDGPLELTAYFDTRPYSNPACNVVDQRLAGQREMRLFVNGGVDLPSVTRGLARYYSRHSLSFFTAEVPRATTMAYALDTDVDALSVQLVAAFPGVDFNNEPALMADPVLWNAILSFATNFLLRPMVEFANQHGDAGTGVTNLVVIRDLERPGQEPLGDPGTSLAGAAISPALLAEFARSMPEEGAFWQGVNLPPNFTPMMVLSHEVLQRVNSRAPDLRDLITAHEFGHTGALTHTMVARNLMFPSVAVGLNDCTDSLDDTQLATMRATLGLTTTTASGALLANRAAAGPAPAAAPAQARRSFTPDRLRAMLAGDRQALRSFVELLFHHRDVF
jgi:hypothetical protein